MQDSATIEGMIGQLVAIHGEAGVCPTAADWRAIFALGDGRAVHILNLLAFKPLIGTEDGPIAGAAAYGRYGTAVAGAFARAGGQRMFFGRVGHAFAFGEVGQWDAAILTRYPSAQALAGLWLDADFIAAHKNRLDGVERSQVLVFSGE